METVESLRYFLPELILTGTLLLVIVVELALKRRKALAAAWLTGVGAAAAALAALGDVSQGPELIFYGTTVVDPFVVFFRIFFSVVAVGVIVFTAPHATDEGAIGRRGGEFYSLMLTALIGAYLLVGAVDVVMIFIALEMVSIPSYVMAGYFKEDRKGSEASTKYIIYGAFASGAMIYGFSLLYGLTGETNIYAMGRVLRTVDPSLGLLAAVVLTLAGAGYKMSMVPFHFWAPDVYEGAPTPAAAFFAVGPKAAGVALLVRLVWALGVAGPVSEPAGAWLAAGGFSWSSILAALAVVTMTLGNLAALLQTNLKRLLAYSGVAHAGYILLGLAAFSGRGLTAVLFYLMVYYFANLAFFLVVDMVEQEKGSVDIDAFEGLGWRKPMLGAGMVIVLLSLTGLPPTAGFIGKLYLFGALIEQKLYWLAVVGVANSVVSLFYYMRVARAMFLEHDEKVPARGPVSAVQSTLLVTLVVPVLIFGIFFGPLIDLARYASGLF